MLTRFQLRCRPHCTYLKQVALKRFIDDIAVEVIEAELLLKCEDIFSPLAVASMDTEIVTAIAGESEEDRTLRQELNKQLEVLRNGLKTCKRFALNRLTGKIAATTTY
jgi:hypothetical protein